MRERHALIIGPKGMLAASHAASSLLSQGEYADGTGRRTSALRFPLDAASLINVHTV